MRDQGSLVLLRRERREDVVGHRPRIATPRPADTDPEAQELLRAERLRERAQSVVASEASARARLEPAGLEVDVVVDDEESAGLHLEEARRGADRAARVVHERLGLQKRQLGAVEPSLREAAGELPAPARVKPPCELVEDEPAGVVPRPLVLAPRV